MTSESTCTGGGAGKHDPNETISISGARVGAGGRSEQIGRYRILRVIGEGGMGTVYEAEQDKPRRVVALKVIKPGYASPQMLKRFDQESQVLGRLQHPGIAQIYEAGTHEVAAGAPGGRGVIVPYFAMEFIRGRGLKVHMEVENLGTRQRLELVAKICDAVHHAHQKGIIHRDLKPGNILVDESGQPKILDFGVARATDSDIQATTIQTDVGQLIGTIPYMSPEQVAADPQELDTRSDVYALGVIAYEALAGRLPYDLKHKMIHEAARVIREEEPAPLSTVNRVFRGDVETIVAKSLEKDKTRRYQSAAEFASDIRRYLHDEPIVARPASAAYQFKKFAQRHKAVVVGVAAVFLVLVAGIIVSTTLYLRAERARSETVLERDRAKAAEGQAQTRQREAEAVTRFLSDMLGSASPWSTISPNVRVADVLDDAAGKLDQAFADDPLIEATLRYTIGKAYHDLGLYAKAQSQLTLAIELRTEHLGPEHGDTLSAIVRSAWVLARSERHKESEILSAELLERCSRSLGPDHELTLEVCQLLSYTLLQQGKIREAAPVVEECFARHVKMLGDDPLRMCWAQWSLFELRLSQGRFDEAESLVLQMKDVYLQAFGPDHPEVIDRTRDLAKIAAARGDFHLAESLHRDALTRWQRSLGPEHPNIRWVLGQLGEALLQQGKVDEAVDCFRQGVAIAQKGCEGLEGECPILAHSLNYLGLGLLRQEKPSEAEPILARSVELMRTHFGSSGRSLAFALLNWSGAHAALGDLPRAEELGRESLALMTDSLGDDHPNTALCMRQLALILVRQGNYEEAEALARESLRICEVKLAPNDFMRFLATSVLGAALAGRQQFAEAEPLLLAANEGLKDREGVPPIRKRELVEYLVKLYDSWDAAEPGKGYAEKAAEWRARLDGTPKSQNAETPTP